VVNRAHGVHEEQLGRSGVPRRRSSANSEAVASRPLEPLPQRSRLDEFKGAVSETSARNQFRIQFLGGAAGEGPEIVKEAQVCATNMFGRFVLPSIMHDRGATGLRILDSGGRDVFWRRKPETDIRPGPLHQPRPEDSRVDVDEALAVLTMDGP
jgi:hypothetical protein